MATMRTYGDRCGVARALDVIGERWALLVVRELVLGPKRFSDLRAGLRGVAPDVLSQRLRELEAAGVLRRTTLPPPGGARVYELTPWGQELEPLVIGLGAWGSRAPFPGGDAELGTDAFVIALKTLFRPAGFAGVVDLRLGDDRFALEVRGGRFEARRGAAEDPDLTILADPGPLAAALWHGGPLDDIELLGDVALFDRFRAAFPAPAPV
jgi:DNA-binding HxlR family transcriptional regulator